MEIRVLKYFLAVAEKESISAAASSLHLSQPTLSRQLKEFEDELGVVLFTRGNRRITLTEEGLLMKKRAEEIISLVTRTENEITASGGPVSGDIYIGSGETEGMRQIARAAHILQQKHPDIRFHIVSADASDVCDQLDRGLLDFGILLGDIDVTRYSFMELPMKDVWGVLMPRSSHLAAKSAVTPEDMRSLPLLMSRQPGNRDKLYRWLGCDSSEVNTVATYNLIYNASLMVDEGMGYAFTLDRLVNTRGSSLCFRPLDPAMELRMSVIWKKNQTFHKASALFLKFLREFLG